MKHLSPEEQERIRKHIGPVVERMKTGFKPSGLEDVLDYIYVDDPEGRKALLSWGIPLEIQIAWALRDEFRKETT